MLAHKPRVGDAIVYQEPSGEAAEIVVKGFRGPDSTIMLARFPFNWFGDQDTDIIWRFSDGTTNPNLHHSKP